MTLVLIVVCGANVLALLVSFVGVTHGIRRGLIARSARLEVVRASATVLARLRRRS